ncbi:hypothetical protein E4U52_000439 [Claviceps spartinae]|nr:hypothetical protein E4U52_000439 [Claviceps spartinae]
MASDWRPAPSGKPDEARRKRENRPWDTDMQQLRGVQPSNEHPVEMSYADSQLKSQQMMTLGQRADVRQ